MDDGKIGLENHDNPLPRELAPGLFWVGDCLPHPYKGQILHMYNSAFLVKGRDGAALIEAGLPQYLPALEAQLGELLDDPRELKHVWVTHHETPHAAGVGRILSRYPEAKLRGDTRDYHLIFPGLADRFLPIEIGETIDLGDTEIAIIEPVIKDLISTQWAFDTKRSALFPADGFAYSHYHSEGHCGMFAEEAVDLPIPELTGLFAELALYWWQFTDLEPFVVQLESLLEELDVRLICPTHGLPIAGIEQTVPKVLEGLRKSSKKLGLGQVID